MQESRLPEKSRYRIAPRVDAAARGFEFVDDFHGADFRRAGKRAAGKAGGQRVEAVHILAQAPAQARDQMHHVRVALDEHQLFDAHRAVFRNAAQVVAAQIDQHDVLGAFLGIGGEFGFQALRLLFRRAPRGRVPAMGR